MTSEKNDKDEVPCCCSQRWTLAYVGFFGFAFVYAVRVNLSVAIICMVKSIQSNNTNGSDLINQTDISCVDDTLSSSTANEHAEFDWNKSIRSTLLASFFYGYIVTQIPGGWLSDRFGGKRVFGVTMFISAVATLLIPICARTSVVLVYVMRVILGLATGVSFPSVQSMWGRWAPPLERSKLVSLTSLGTMFGNVGTFATAGLLCDYGFDNGWGSIFYISGGLTAVWVFFWFYMIADTPQQHPRISDVEKEYIVSSVEYNTNIRTFVVPWKELFKSSALWACLTAHVCNNWTNYTLLTSLPDFMKAVLKFDIKQNGLLSAVPYICQAISAFAAGQAADFVRSKHWLTTTGTRRVFQVTAFLGAGVCTVVTGFMSCEHRTLAVVFLSLAVMFTGISRAGYLVNHIDFAPKYGGVLYGITNTAATVPGMVAPIVAGALTPDDTQEQWRNVFYVCAAFDVFGALIFGMFGSGKLEPWAMDKDITLVVPENEGNAKPNAEGTVQTISGKGNLENGINLEPIATETEKESDGTEVYVNDRTITSINDESVSNVHGNPAVSDNDAATREIIQPEINSEDRLTSSTPAIEENTEVKESNDITASENAESLTRRNVGLGVSESDDITAIENAVSITTGTAGPLVSESDYTVACGNEESIPTGNVGPIISENKDLSDGGNAESITSRNTASIVSKGDDFTTSRNAESIANKNTASELSENDDITTSRNAELIATTNTASIVSESDGFTTSRDAEPIANKNTASVASDNDHITTSRNAESIATRNTASIVSESDDITTSGNADSTSSENNKRVVNEFTANRENKPITSIEDQNALKTNKESTICNDETKDSRNGESMQ